MCNHDVIKLHREADRIRAEWFEAQHKKLQERELLKRGYEMRIKKSLAAKYYWFARVSFLGIKQPHTVVEITTNLATCGKVVGLGVARCQARDKWNEEEGVERATKKAVRNAARKLAGLNGYNGRIE